ncbi:MAG: hypothetical protein H8E94_09460 [Alphaproteobacteria bacterium]|nr:hypothetical protein [Alphaproteobacteria bacterium]
MKLVRFTEGSEKTEIWVSAERVATVSSDGHGKTYIVMANAAGILVNENLGVVINRLVRGST